MQPFLDLSGRLLTFFPMQGLASLVLCAAASLACVVQQGGLNFKPDEVALPVSFAGLGLILFSLLAYQRIQKRVGCLACAKIGLTVAIPMVLLIPMPSLLVPRCASISVYARSRERLDALRPRPLALTCAGTAVQEVCWCAGIGPSRAC